MEQNKQIEYTAIRVDKATRKTLNQLKLDFDFKSMDALLNTLIKYYKITNGTNN